MPLNKQLEKTWYMNQRVNYQDRLRLDLHLRPLNYSTGTVPTKAEGVTVVTQAIPHQGLIGRIGFQSG